MGGTQWKRRHGCNFAEVCARDKECDVNGGVGGAVKRRRREWDGGRGE